MVPFQSQKAVTTWITWARVVVLGAAIILALVAHDGSLASSNLLPRRLAFHGAAVIALLSLRRIQPTRLRWWWLVLLLGAVLGWAASPLRHLCTDGVLDALATLALAWAVATRVESRRRLVRLVVVVAAVGAALGLLEQWLPLSWFLNEATRPAGPFASRATAGAFVAASLPLVPFLFSGAFSGPSASDRARRGQLGTFVLWALEVAFVVSTRARAAWVGGLMALALTGARAREPRARHVWTAALLGVVLALALTPGPQLAWSSSSPYLDSAASLAHAHRDDRLELWGPSLRLFLAHPLLGVGPGAFEVAFAPFAPAAFTEAGVRVEAPHHEGLRVLLEWGAVGAGLLAVALVLARPRGGPHTHPSKRTRALQAALLCLGITSLTGKTFLEPPTLVMAAVLTGLLVRQLRASHRRPYLRTLPWPAMVAGAALAALALSVDVPRLEDGRRLAIAKALADRGLTRQAWESAAPAIARSADVSWWLWATRLVCDAGDAQRCDELAQSASQRFPGHPLLGAVRRASEPGRGE